MIARDAQSAAGDGAESGGPYHLRITHTFQTHDVKREVESIAS